MNERYRALGFKSYSDYSRQVKAGKVPSTGIKRRLRKRALPPPDKRTKRQIKILTRQMPPVGPLNRTEYESKCPFVYGINDQVGQRLVDWINSVFDEIERLHANEHIYSGAWRIFGKMALDHNPDGSLKFEPAEKEEWSVHLDWQKMRANLARLIFAYGNHEFIEHGRSFPRTTKYRLYVFLITRLKVSVITTALDPGLKEREPIPTGERSK